MDESIKFHLFKVMDILEDYLSEVVFAGGWAPLIYYHYLVGDKTRTPLLTQEFDLRVRRRVSEREKSLHQLLQEAGCSPSLAIPPQDRRRYTRERLKATISSWSSSRL